MDEIVGFPGDWPLAQLQTNLQLEEAGGLELFDCIVATDKDNQPINVCKFHVLDAGNRPKEIILAEHGSPKPAHAGGVLFTDVVVVEQRFTTVDFYRVT